MIDCAVIFFIFLKKSKSPEDLTYVMKTELQVELMFSSTHFLFSILSNIV